MEYLILFIYWIGCIIAFFLLDYKNRGNENVEQPMMFVVATLSWLVVAIVLVSLIIDHINKKIALENDKMISNIISKLNFVPKGNQFRNNFKEFKKTKKK